jgi:hypothetical protein
MKERESVYILHNLGPRTLAPSPLYSASTVVYIFSVYSRPNPTPQREERHRGCVGQHRNTAEINGAACSHQAYDFCVSPRFFLKICIGRKNKASSNDVYEIITYIKNPLVLCLQKLAIL